MREFKEWWRQLDQDHQLFVLAGAGFVFLAIVMIQPVVTFFGIFAAIMLGANRNA